MERPTASCLVPPKYEVTVPYVGIGDISVLFLYTALSHGSEHAKEGDYLTNRVAFEVRGGVQRRYLPRYGCDLRF